MQCRSHAPRAQALVSCRRASPLNHRVSVIPLPVVCLDSYLAQPLLPALLQSLHVPHTESDPKSDPEPVPVPVTEQVRITVPISDSNAGWVSEHHEVAVKVEVAVSTAWAARVNMLQRLLRVVVMSFVTL